MFELLPVDFGRNDGDVGLVERGDVSHVSVRLGASTVAMARSLRVLGLFEENDGVVDVVDPDVAVLGHRPREAAGIDDVTVTRVVGGEGEMQTLLEWQ